MKWVIEYNNKTFVTENQVNFNYASKDNVKYFYFLDKATQNAYGLNLENKRFFIKDKEFDFKIQGSDVKLIEYKTISFNINSNLQKIKSWNLGLEVNSSNYNEKYIMTIDLDRNVNLIATRKELSSGKVEEKIIRLQ